MITVCTWFWRQPEARTQYDPIHVLIWADMIRRNLTIPHRLAVVTDEPLKIDGVEIIAPPRDFDGIRISTWPEHRPQCLRRLSMFRPDAAGIFGDEIFCTDLDLVVCKSLDPLLNDPGDFRMAVGTAPGRPYNGSAIYLRAGTRPEVFKRFTPERAEKAGKLFVGSDQAWISHILGPDEATWGEADGLVYHGLGMSPETQPRVIFYPGPEKPWMRGHDPKVANNYRRNPAGRCLILGYSKRVWRDLALALDKGPYDAVIASPEAAEHWPGKLLAVASDDWEAARLARMHGFDDVMWCGKTEVE